MAKFKKGDVVECTDNGGDFASAYLVPGEKYIIEEVEGYAYPLYRLEGVRGGFYSSTRFNPVDTQQKREELKAAIELVQAYEVVTPLDTRLVWARGATLHRSVDQMVDKLLPLETPQQKKLKELEQQQLEIVAKMEQLRSEL